MAVRFKRKSNKISVDIRDFKKFEKRLQNMRDEAIDKFIKESAVVLAGTFIDKVKNRTPVGQYGKRVEFTTREGEFVSFKANTQPVSGGTLRDAWHMGELKQTAGGYEIEIYNNVPYGLFVEAGHVIRNKKGGEIKGFVEGRFMLRDSEIEMVFESPRILEEKLEIFLRKMISEKGGYI